MQYLAGSQGVIETDSEKIFTNLVLFANKQDTYIVNINPSSLEEKNVIVHVIHLSCQGGSIGPPSTFDTIYSIDMIFGLYKKASFVL